MSALGDRSSPTVLHVVAAWVLGLMCGSELNVAAFAHPTLNRQALEVHIPVRAAFAKLFGRVMPFWMAGSTLLNLLLLMPFEHLQGSGWRLAAIALGIQVLAVVLSLIFPVPINNRIMRWTVYSLPADWKVQERLWDSYHLFRTLGLCVGFVLLTISLALR